MSDQMSRYLFNLDNRWTIRDFLEASSIVSPSCTLQAFIVLLVTYTLLSINFTR